MSAGFPYSYRKLIAKKDKIRKTYIANNSMKIAMGVVIKMFSYSKLTVSTESPL
jgi:hypothetical protein